MVCDVEFQGAAPSDYTDVIYPEPGPTGCNHDGIRTLIHDESTHFCFFHTIARLEGKVVPIDGYIDHLRAIKRIVSEMESIFPRLRSVICKTYDGVFIRQFKGLSARVFAVSYERTVGIDGILGFQSCIVLCNRQLYAAEHSNEK